MPTIYNKVSGLRSSMGKVPPMCIFLVAIYLLYQYYVDLKSNYYEYSDDGEGFGGHNNKYTVKSPGTKSTGKTYWRKNDYNNNGFNSRQEERCQHMLAKTGSTKAKGTSQKAIKRPDNIGELPLMLEWLSNSPHCWHKADLFNRMFTVSQRSGKLQLPKTFEDKVIGWLGGPDNPAKLTLENVHQQTVTSVFNRFTHENTIFNPLRGMRPGANSGKDTENYLNNLVNESSHECDFCRPLSSTAGDVFEYDDTVHGNSSGKDVKALQQHQYQSKKKSSKSKSKNQKIELYGDVNNNDDDGALFEVGKLTSKHAITASNVFKYDAHHALTIFKRHDPLSISREEFIDAMKLSLKWFRVVHEQDKSFKFPHMMWDLLPKASASQVHPHMQISITNDQYYGSAEHMYQAMKDYNNVNKNNDNRGTYFEDLISIYEVLGLLINDFNDDDVHDDARGSRNSNDSANSEAKSDYKFKNKHNFCRRGNKIVAFANITPKKEKEMIVIGGTNDDDNHNDFFDALYKTLAAMRNEMDVISYSLAIFFPEMEESKANNSHKCNAQKLPIIARIIDRGVPDSPRSDISAMELFGASNVNADPFIVAKSVKKGIKRKKL